MATHFFNGDTVIRRQDIAPNGRRIHAATDMPGGTATVVGSESDGYIRVEPLAADGPTGWYRMTKLIHIDSQWCEESGEYVSDVGDANRSAWLESQGIK